jgi:hypothetical protein
MTYGGDFQTVIAHLLEGGSLGSTLTRTTVTRGNTGSGGYGGETEVDGATASVNCIPSKYLKDRRLGGTKFGDLDEGEIALLIKGAQAMSQDDKITFESVDYRIRIIEPLELNDVVIAKRLILVKKR